jgi:Tol biopolymer transport system component
MRVLPLLAAAGLLSCGSASGAAFPGHNGLIVFGRTTSGQPPAIMAVDPVTGAQRPLAAGVEPAWSADGSRLAFVQDGVVYVADAGAQGPVALGSGEFPSWSPDGTQIAVSRYDEKPLPGHPRGTLQLVVLTVADGAAFQLTDSTSDVTLPAWSPDGSTIAYATPAGLGTVPAGGGAAAPVPTPGATVNGGPSWAPDGSQLAFVDARGQVWTVKPDGSGAQQVTYTLVGSNGSTARPAWSPDGGSIAWTQGADLCTTDLAGNVRRLTRTLHTDPSAVASFPDWQPAPTGAGTIAAPPPGTNDELGCDWNPGVRVELLSVNVSTQNVALKAPQQLVFVNHTTLPLSVTTTLHSEHATVEPGNFFGVGTEPGSYEFTVTGYPDGVPRRGSFVVAAAGSVAIAAHAPIRFGTRTLLTGTAKGPAGGAVAIWATPGGSTQARRVASVTPVAGRWQLAVSPGITTRYQARFEGATMERLLRVMPVLRVRRSGNTVRATLTPAAKLAHRQVFLFRSSGRAWAGFKTSRTARDGSVVFRNLPAGRYYVGYEGDDLYWGTAGEPFDVRR